MSEKRGMNRGEDAELELVMTGPESLNNKKTQEIGGNVSQPDYMSWSICSLFLCVVWGIFYLFFF